MSSSLLKESEEKQEKEESELFTVPETIVISEKRVSIKTTTPTRLSPRNTASSKASTPENKSPRTPDSVLKSDLSPPSRKVATPERKMIGKLPMARKKVGKVVIQEEEKIGKVPTDEKRERRVPRSSYKGIHHLDRIKFNKKLSKKVSDEKEFQGLPSRRSSSLPSLRTSVSSTGFLRLVRSFVFTIHLSWRHCKQC